LEAYVSLGWPPPTTNPSGGGVIGIFATQYNSGSTPEISNFPSYSSGCHYYSNYNNVSDDFTGGNFPTSVGPVDNVGSSWVPNITAGTGFATQTGYYQSPSNTPGQSMDDPQSVRYAAFNVADNMAAKIRQDTTLKPMLFVIGLNYTVGTEEPLDADWLARVANDPNYVTVGTDTNVIGANHSVYQAGQTPGMYCNSTPATLQACFAQVTSQLLRLSQ
jgi:hypothetical protein